MNTIKITTMTNTSVKRGVVSIKKVLAAMMVHGD